MSQPIQGLPSDDAPDQPTYSPKLSQSLSRVAPESGVRPAEGRTCEWVLLPDHFRWRDVCDLFEEGSGGDDQWRFRVSRQAGPADSEPLYSVWVATRFSVASGPRVSAPDQPAAARREGLRLSEPALKGGA
jgi:hypothetical protein